MSRFLVKGEPEILDWVREHGHDPATLSNHVILNEDGTVTVRRFLLDDKGHRYLVGADPDQQPATVEVVITPTRPFPGAAS